LGEPDSRGLQVLASVKGRTDDLIYTLSGTPVGRLDPIFKGGSGIKYAQIIQSENGNVLLKLVPDIDYKTEHGESLREELIKRLGRDTPVEIARSNGKFRPVISHFKKSAQS
jgi:phenylacetate-CoA ligase